MDQLQIFKKEEFGEIRTVDIKNQIYFVANDVAKSLGYARPADAVTAHCKGSVKHRLPTNGGNQEFKVIPKGDVIRLAAKSKLPGAEKFESWIFDEVIPGVMETGSYSTKQPKSPNLASVNNAAKILRGVMDKAGIEPKLQLTTLKSMYAQVGVEIPLLVEADQPYYDTKTIAKKVGMYTKSSGKPAGTAVSQLIQSLPIEDHEKKAFYESKGGWQGTVYKYNQSVIAKVVEWLEEYHYPTVIKGGSKSYQVTYDLCGVA